MKGKRINEIVNCLFVVTITIICREIGDASKEKKLFGHSGFRSILENERLNADVWRMVVQRKNGLSSSDSTSF